MHDFVAKKNLCMFEYLTSNITREVGYGKVKTAIKQLKMTNAAGVDNLNTRFIKMLKKPLLHILTCICNRSFEQQVYPDLYKLAHVTLLQCKDSKEKFNPQSPSKVQEKVVLMLAYPDTGLSY